MTQVRHEGPSHLSLRRVVGSFSWLSGAEAIRAGLGAVLTAYLARVLGPEGFGAWGFAAAVLVWLTAVVDGGCSPLGTREIAREPSQAAGVLKAVLKIRLTLAIVTLLLLALFTAAIDKPPVVKNVLLLSGLSIVTYAVGIDWLFYGLQKSRTVAVAAVIRIGIFAPAVFLAVQGPEHLLRVPVLQAMGEGAALLFLGGVALGMLKRGGRAGGESGHRDAVALLRDAAPLWASGLLRAVHYTFSAVALGILMTNAQLGAFVAAQKLMLLLLGFSSLYFYAYLPLASSAFRDGGAALQGVLSRSIRLTAAATIPIAIGTSVLAPQLVALVYGSGYQASVTPLRVMVWSVPLAILAGHFRQALLAADRQRTDLRWVACGAAATVVLNLVLIPRAGIAGAALASTVGEGLVLGAAWPVTRQLGPLSVGRAFSTPVAAGTLMCAAIWWIQDWNLGVTVPCGVLVYLAAFLLLNRLR